MESGGERIRVILNFIQILDKLEPFYKERGEFRFTVRISGGDPERELAEVKLPKSGHYEISDRPGWNRMSFDETLFEGEVSDRLVVAFEGEELDQLSANDQLDRYSRVFEGPVTTWLGSYWPGEDIGTKAAADPENMSNWRIGYTIERA